MKFLHTFVASTLVLAAAVQAAEPNSVTVVPGSYDKGATSLSAAYTQATNNIRDWPLNTGGAYGVSLNNSNWASNTIIAIGNGGGITLQFDSPIYPVAGEKEFGIFTAQMINAGTGGYMNGNMEAAILVSQNGTDWYTLAGVSVVETYTGTSHKLNAPTVAYQYGTIAAACDAGSGKKTLSSLTVADYQTPMPDDNLFNGTGTDALRKALLADNTTATYMDVFGSSGGGNWFDISDCGLDAVNYIRINAVNCGAGIRLDAVFSSAAAMVAAVPEPASLSLLLVGGMGLLARRRKQ